VEERGLPQSDELPELSPELSALPSQDIPEAVREASEPSQSSSSRKSFSSRKGLNRTSKQRNPLIWLVGGLGAAALIAVPLVLALRSQSFAVFNSNPTAPDKAPASAAQSPVASPTPTLLGHLPYTEAPAAELEPIVSDGSITLRKAAAKKYREMVDAAAADGVLLIPISGFRSVAEQESVFFDVKAERGEGTTTRASVSAPPGYSEHHTGYAVDLGDGDAPSANLQFSFEETKAYKWLKQNAAYYSFEMSFPKNNPMGVSYEPWHWRFVGDRQSLETFYRARHLGEGQQANQSSEAPENQGGQAEQSAQTEDQGTGAAQ
jgi:zinc D-Ala-D-Ala carboxypeptidase